MIEMNHFATFFFLFYSIATLSANEKHLNWKNNEQIYVKLINNYE